jgi:DNA-binding transcriptional regulator YbjK
VIETYTRRKPDPDTRRRELCDAAIELLAEDGMKGLSHLKVDRRLGVADGTTSFYFRTRSALVDAVAERVTDLDLIELSTATRPAPAAQGPSGLARLVMASATGEPLARTRARHELALQANRDPELAAVLRRNSDRFSGLIRDFVVRMQSGDNALAPAVIDEQTYVLTTFIGGVLLSFAAGDATLIGAEQLDRIMTALVAGIGAAP